MTTGEVVVYIANAMNEHPIIPIGLGVTLTVIGMGMWILIRWVAKGVKRICYKLFKEQY